MTESRGHEGRYESANRSRLVLDGLDGLLAKLAGLYMHLHRNPELSRQERETASAVAAWLREEGFSVTEGIGGFGVVGVLARGPGPTVMLRADMDALPVEEKTGLPYASTVRATNRHGFEVPVMHACGHDLHTACLLGAAHCLSRARSAWSGTLLIVAQPAEEEVSGARAMLNDGLFERFPRPDYVLGQHTWPAPLGTIGHRPGPFFGGCTRLAVTVYGRGGHGSTPHLTVDPVVICAHIVSRLQTVAAREAPPEDRVVVTVGVLRAGTAANIIPDNAYLEIDLRAATPAAMARTVAAVHRVIRAEAAAGSAPREPEIVTLVECPTVVNDEALDATIEAAHAAHFGTEKMLRQPFSSTAEDFAEYGAEGASLDFWALGIGETGCGGGACTPLHSPTYAPTDMMKSISAGTEALVVAALAVLEEPRAVRSEGEARD